MAETGMMNCSNWLCLLENTEVNRIALERAARHIKSDGEEVVYISDSTITSAKALLPIITTKKLEIKLIMTEPDIQELIFAHHTYKLLFLYRHYRYPQQTPVSDSFLLTLPR